MAMQLRVKKERYDERIFIDKIIRLLRGKILTRDSIRRITEVLYTCNIYENTIEEEWKRIAMEKYIKWEEKEKNIKSDFIEAGEMEI
jgi:hypothetical protein